EAFRAGIAGAAPFLADTIGEIDDWDKVKLLTVQVNRLPDWHRPGLLCIGDAAHAMSPAGGVGINLAVQDAVATANLLAAKLKQGNVTEDDLRAVQKRREMPVRRIQAGQVFIHRRMFGPGGKPFALPWPARKLIVLLAPVLRRVAARVVGLDFRPEHIQTPDVQSDSRRRA
ncbi:MAG TPA: FAD-dependent monooxygenase, partial [Thermoanaerobaculia bacterium]